MIATTDHNNHNALLRRDVRKLGNMLGEVLVLHGGQELFDKVETIREFAKSVRQEFNANTYLELKKEIKSLKPPIREQVIRAFSIYFHLINIAEQNHRIRRRRQYLLSEEKSQPFSLKEAVSKVKEYDLSKENINEILHDLSIELIMTAHPTEAMKRTVLGIQKRISKNLRKLDNPLCTKRERAYLEESLFNEVTALWHTNELRERRPEVLDEVKNGLYYFDNTLFDTLPSVFQELEMELQEQISEEDWHVPNFIRFGSWIGGDRDGNPNVTPDITWETLKMQRSLILRKYEVSIQEMMTRFSQSTDRISIDQAFVDRVEKDEQTYLTEDEKWHVKSEVFRRKFAVILKRLRGVGQSTTYGYKNSEQLVQDLTEIKMTAERHLPETQKLKTIRKIIRQVKLFGFHLATLDIRNHSGEHEAAVDEILKEANVTNRYSELSEVEKQKVLTKAIQDHSSLLVNRGFSEETEKILDIFRMIKKAHDEFGKCSIEVYLVSMTEAPSDLLEVLLLAKETNLFRIDADGHVESDLDVVPLLETIDDLVAGPKIMSTLFESDIYRKQLQARDKCQEIMLGYSDGSKDGGTLSANWNLFKAQLEIHNMAKAYDIRLKFFHGRGGSLGRGGGSLNTSILSQPIETLGDGIKITEQGEVLSSRYLLEDIAFRNLEQAAASLFERHARVSLAPDEVELRKKEWEEAMEFISEKSLAKYQSLVFGDRDFLTYFHQATPLHEIGALKIGSRPMSRKKSERFEDLRAIPWVFAWTQARHFLPAWYAAGTGLKSFIDADPDHLNILQTMYKEWEFFKVTINNLQMALLKADMRTAKEYLELVEDPALAKRIYEDIEEEYERTKDVLLKISGNGELLSHNPNIKDSVHLRNPYVDPLNLLQVKLIKKLRTSPNPSDDLVTEVLLTISGIAAGLVNTG